jgi:hypothetical protein
MPKRGNTTVLSHLGKNTTVISHQGKNKIVISHQGTHNLQKPLGEAQSHTPPGYEQSISLQGKNKPLASRGRTSHRPSEEEQAISNQGKNKP